MAQGNWKSVVVGLIGLLSLAGTARAGVYVFGNSTDWYAAGMTAVDNGAYNTGLKLDTAVTSRLQAVDRQGWGYPTIPAGYWAGAEWTAPTNEVVTKIEITGYHAGDDPADPTWGFAVLGGTAAGTATDRTVMSGTGTQTQPGGALAYNSTGTLGPIDGITKLQFRALIALKDTQVASFPVAGFGYFGAINYIKITTVVVGHQYVFSNDTDWFAAGMTDVNNGVYGTGLKIDTAVTNRLQAIDRQGWGYPTIPAGYWAGAEWTAPDGEVITKVEITGYHRADNPADPDWGYGVYAGGPTGSITAVTLMTGTGTESSNGALAYSNSATPSVLSGLTRLQFQSLVALKDNLVASYPIGGYGYFGAINYIKITTAIPQPDQNVAFEIPEIGPIVIDGDISNWPASIPWSQPYIAWNGTGLPSTTTRAKFAWNQAQNLLYVAIQTDEASIHAGGHAVVGVSTSRTNAAFTGDGATQLAFDILSGHTVAIMNEIDYYANKYDHSWPGWHSGTQDVQAAFSVNNDVYTYEIAIPLWTNWVTMAEKTVLSVGDVIYLYSILEDKLEGGNGTNLTYNGNPNFAMTNGFKFASALTLGATVAMPTPTPTPTSTRIPGDANNDGRVNVSDLGILAAHYGLTAGVAWEQGDFNNDGTVNVSDLGMLAANYGFGTGSSLDFDADARALGLPADAKAETPELSTLGCASAGLPLVAGLLLLGLCLIKLDE